MAKSKTKSKADAIRESIMGKLGKINKTIVQTTDNAHKPEGWGTGSIQLSQAVGDLVYKGRLTQLASFESGGKTTITIEVVIETISKYPDKIVVFADMERHLDMDYVNAISNRILGCDIPEDNFILLKPANAEQLDVALSEIFSSFGHDISLLVIDSVASTRLGNQMDVIVGDKQAQAIHARLWSEFSPKLNTWATTYDTAVLLTNQLRQKLATGAMDRFKISSNIGINYGSNSGDDGIIATGGNTLRFYLAVSYLLTMRKKIKVDVVNPLTGEVTQEEISTVYSIENRKNKVDIPYRRGSYVITYGEGLDDSQFLQEWAREEGLIETRGSFISYKGKSAFKANGKRAFHEQIEKVIPELKQMWLDKVNKSSNFINAQTKTDDKKDKNKKDDNSSGVKEISL